MTNDLKTILVIGDAPRAMGYNMVCKLLDAGYKVRAPNPYANEMDEVFVGNLSKLDLDFDSSNVKDNDNFTIIEYDPNSETEVKRIVSGHYCVIYLSSILYDCQCEINSNTNGIVDNKTLKSVANISRACGVHQFICGLIPVVYRTEGDTEVAKYISVNFGDISQEHFQKLTESNFKVTMLQPRFLPSDFRRWKQELNLKTINNHTINVSKVRLFGSNKKQPYFVPSLQFSEKEALICVFQIKSIVDICVFILEYSGLVHKKNWLFRKIYQLVLEHYYFCHLLVSFIRNPRVPGRVKFVLRSAKRLFDAFKMMALLHLWPEQVYRFSTRKLLPNRSERFNINDRATIPFKLIEAKTSKIQRTEELNVVMRGSSFDVSKLDELKGPIYLVNFGVPIKSQKDVNYLEQSIKHAYKLRQSGVLVYHVEINRVAENGETYPPDGYTKAEIKGEQMLEEVDKKDNLSSSDMYKKLLDDPDFKRIAIAENICRPFKLPLSSSFRPAGAGLSAICALSYFANTINVYGWDFYLKSSPEDMSSWEAFSNLNKFKLDIHRSRLHFECAIINYYYGYHLSKLPNINNYGYLGKLDRHERLIKKIERILFN